MQNLTATSHDRRDNLAGHSLAAVGTCEDWSRAWSNLDCWTRYHRDIHWMGMSPLRTRL